MSGEQVLEDWEQELMDEEWDEPGEVVHPRGGSMTSIQSVRFQHDELQRIREAAKAAGLTTSMFIRQAVAFELARVQASAEDPRTLAARTADELEHAAAVVRQLGRRSPKSKSAARK